MNTRERIINFVKENPKANGTDIMRGLNMKPKSANLYQTLKRMVAKGELFVTLNKKYIVAPADKAKGYELPVSDKYKLLKKPKKKIGRPRKYPLPETQRLPLASETKSRTPSPLERIFLAEIDYLDAGVESLKITRSYLERRIEQIRANEQN